MSNLEKIVYDYVARHFLATVSYKCTVVRRHFEANIDSTSFRSQKEFVKDPGWKEILHGVKAEPTPNFNDEWKCHIKGLELESKEIENKRDVVT